MGISICYSLVVLVFLIVVCFDIPTSAFSTTFVSLRLSRCISAAMHSEDDAMHMPSNPQGDRSPQSGAFQGAGSPRPHLPPEEIPTLLMMALGLNDFPSIDSGIKSVWEFAGDVTRHIFNQNRTEFIESVHETANTLPTSFYGAAMNGKNWTMETPLNKVGGENGWIATQVMKTYSSDGRMRRWQWELRKNRRPPNLNCWYVESIGSSDREGKFEISLDSKNILHIMVQSQTLLQLEYPGFQRERSALLRSSAGVIARITVSQTTLEPKDIRWVKRIHSRINIQLPNAKMVLIVAVFKPLIYIWAGLNVIDDIALLIRLGRLGASVVPYPGKKAEDMCGVCDDVIGDLLVGSDGISVIPCSAACLGMSKCIEMCEKVKETSESSTEFPCVAAGFCDPMETGYVTSSDIDCKAGRFFSCKPRQYCRRKREKFKFKCELRPGIGRWNGIKTLASTHTVALAEGLANQRHCGEEGASKYCIARPLGTGIYAEWLGHFISLFVGGYKTVYAIETPGGDDDRQWLTFWLIFSVWLFFERYFARVVLSTIPFYYECKLGLLFWLITKSGAELCYRRLRLYCRSLFSNSGFIISDEDAAQKTLDILEKTGGKVVREHMRRNSSEVNVEKRKMVWLPDGYWEYDPNATDDNDVREQLFYLCKFLLSTKGAQMVEDSDVISEVQKKMIIERAAQVISFQPRYLQIHLLGTIDETKGKIPIMDSNGLADPYVECFLTTSDGESSYPPKGVKSRIAYRTRSPQWNQQIEIPLMGGVMDSDGFFQSVDLKTMYLYLRVLDADVGLWSVFFHVFRTLIWTGIIFLLAAHVKGATDEVTENQKNIAFGIAVALITGYAIGYNMAVVLRSDDELVGTCKVPLGILLDQCDHSLLLTLHPEAKPVKPNEEGKYGILRVNLDLSVN